MIPRLLFALRMLVVPPSGCLKARPEKLQRTNLHTVRGGRRDGTTQYALAAALLAVWYAAAYWQVTLFLALLGVLGMVAAALNRGSRKNS